MTCWRNLIRKVVATDDDDDDNSATFLVRKNGQPIPTSDAAKEFYAFGRMVNLWILSPRMARKLCSTASGHLGGRFEQSAAAHMSHSLQTARRSYQAISSATPQTIACQHDQLRQARKGDEEQPSEKSVANPKPPLKLVPATTPTAMGKQPFSPEEDQLITAVCPLTAEKPLPPEGFRGTLMSNRSIFGQRTPKYLQVSG